LDAKPTISAGQMYRDLVSSEKSYELQTGEFTVQMFAEDTRRSDPSARRRLIKLREDGVIDGEKRVIDGRERWVFWCVDEEEGSATI
jgi:predicted transcriptional regulator